MWNVVGKIAVKVLLVVALLLLFIPALQPLLTRDFTCGYDNTFHLWRAVQVGHLWEQGVFYSRWAPDMAHGFGFPLFLFMPPGTAYIAAFFHYVGMLWPVAINATFALGIVLGGLFIYFLARDFFGPWGGVVTAVAYVYAPFLAYDVFYRGSLSESFAWAFPPLVIFALQRWGVKRQRGFLLIGSLGFAALLLCHHPFAFLFAPLLVGWVLLSAYLERDWSVLLRGATLGVLGLGIAAFFWLPPLLERSWVQADRLLGSWVFDYSNNFISLRHLLALPRLADPSMVNDWPEKSLGAIPVMLALLPFLSWRQFSREIRWIIGLLWIMVLGFSFATLEPSLWVWDHIPLLSFVQFPWRFLGPAAFCVALLIGAGVSGLLERTGFMDYGGLKVLAVLGFVAVLIASNLGWFYPRHCAPPADISVTGMITWERATDTLGTTAKGEYLPVWVKQIPDGDMALDAAYQAAYQDGGLIKRAYPVISSEAEISSTTQSGPSILGETYGAIRSRIIVTSPVAFEMRYLAFYYPGWQVQVDGVPVKVTPEPVTGLLRFWVSKGQHTIEIKFGEIPMRWLADGISVISLLALGIVFLRSAPVTKDTQVSPTEKRTLPVNPLMHQGPHVRDVLVLLLSVVLIVELKVIISDGIPMPWHRSRLTASGSLQGVAAPLDINFDGRARLLGIDWMPDTFTADAAPEIRLYGQVSIPDGRDWRIGLDLTDENGISWVPDGLRSVRSARTPPPMPEWPSGSYALWAYYLDLLPGTPPGKYQLSVSLFDRDTLAPASVLGQDGNPLGPSVSLGAVQVFPPQSIPDLESLEVAEDAELVGCGALGLWQMKVDRVDAAPGDVVGVRWVWEALDNPSKSLTATLTLRDAMGEARRVWSLPPSASWWPVDAWQTGERWVGRHIVRLPGSLESGAYTLEVTLPGCEPLSQADLNVVAPQRVWELPASISETSPGNSQPTELGDLVRLAGFTVDSVAAAPGEGVTLTLAWQTLAEMDDAYHIFVHVVGEDGRLLAQSDGEPVNWTRPTTGWAVGEFVIEERQLVIPSDAAPGEYQIQAGLYLLDGPRLLTAGGEDALMLGTLSINSK